MCDLAIRKAMIEKSIRAGRLRYFKWVTKSTNKTPEEWVPIAEKLVDESGSIPCKEWMRKNGYYGLCGAMRRRPELFAHLKQDKQRGRVNEEWVSVAEKIVEEYGYIPGPRWQRKNGYGGLYWVIRKCPELFVHLKREPKRTRSLREWIPVAEGLEKEHGYVPCSTWLIENGLMGLYEAMKKYPELFAHLRRENKRGRTPEEWVPIAKELEKEHGCVPCLRRLQDNNYGGLYDVMKKYPELFTHLRRENKRGKTPKEWVLVAERLVREYGYIPCGAWLKKNGYSGLAQVIRKNPKLFAHLKKESKRRKLPKEWIPIAEKLKKKHGGFSSE